MTYKNNFIVEIMCDGKIMRIKGGEVKLPFGSEYSVYIKNLNSMKAVMSLCIDGKDVLDGNLRVVMPKSSITINGFMKGSESTKKFKFTKKTKRISKYRGDFPEDGIVRVEYWFEKPKLNPHDWYVKSTYPYYDTGRSENDWYKSLYGSVNTTWCATNINLCSCVKEGITVNGSNLDETFVHADVGELEYDSDVISIKLVGYDEKRNKKVLKPIYTKTKLTCQICGTKSKSSANYCRHCGNNLN